MEQSLDVVKEEDETINNKFTRIRQLLDLESLGLRVVERQVQ